MSDPVLFVIYIFISLFIAWMWVDYFRLIDVFEKENLLHVGVTFLLGAGSVFLVLGLHEIWRHPFGLVMDGTFLNDFLYCTLSIGLIEECAKAVPVVIAFVLFRKHFNEPVDYIAYFSVAALGFAAAENVVYFSRYGAEIISSRAILSNVGHMLFASFTAYGVVLARFRNVKPAFIIIPLFLLLGSVFHGLYDLGLMYEDLGWFGTILTIVFFFLGVSVFANILNNALNISPFFTYKHVIHSSGVAVRMLIYYAALFAVQCIIVVIMADVETVVYLVLRHALTILPIVLITVIRLSRFKLIKDRWHWIRPELPFSLFSRNAEGDLGLRLSIKGDPYSDYHVNKHYEAHMLICPVSRNSTYLKHCRKAYIFRKLYINGEIAHYGVRIFTDDTMEESQAVLIQMKRGGIDMMNNYPVVAVLDVQNAEDIDTSHEPVHAPFLEWAILKPLPPAEMKEVTT